jgi:hypothetical protein
MPFNILHCKGLQAVAIHAAAPLAPAFPMAEPLPVVAAPLCASQ